MPRPAAGIGERVNHDVAGPVRIRRPALLATNLPPVVGPGRGDLRIGGVRAAAGFRQTEDEHALARGQIGKVGLLLIVPATQLQRLAPRLAAAPGVMATLWL